MSKRSYEMHVEDREYKPKTAHPIWRGVGFAMIVLIPIISYAATEVLVQQNMKLNLFPWTYDIVAKQGDLLWNGDPLLYFKILITITFMLVFYALFTLVTFLVNSTMGVPRYGPFDVPPIKARVRKRAR